MKISTQKIKMIGINGFLTASFILLYFLSSRESIKEVAIIGLMQYAWMLYTWYRSTKSVINVYFIFLIMSLAFYLGQPILYLLGIEINSVMHLQNSPFTEEQIVNTMVYLLSGMALFHFGASFAIEKLGEAETKKVNKKAMVFVGSILFAISVVPQLTFTMNSLITTLTVGYSNIFQSETVQGTGLDGGIPRFLSGFFKASLFLLILGNINNKKWFKFWLFFAIAFSGLMILSGQRGSNVLLIAGLILIYHYAVKKFTNKQVLKVGVFSVIGLVILSIVSSLRNIGISNYSFSEITTLIMGKNYLAEIIGEMGFTLIACTTVMVYSPTVIPFNEGATYFNSLFSLIPNLFWTVNPAAVGGVDQVFKGFLMHNSGIGSSFIIEAYYNFGKYGLLLMPLFGFLIGKLHFSMAKASLSKDYLKLFFTVFLATMVLWYVRSETITFWRNFAYYAVFPIVSVYIYSIYARKTNGQKVSRNSKETYHSL